MRASARLQAMKRRPTSTSPAPAPWMTESGAGGSPTPSPSQVWLVPGPVQPGHDEGVRDSKRRE